MCGALLPKLELREVFSQLFCARIVKDNTYAFLRKIFRAGKTRSALACCGVRGRIWGSCKVGSRLAISDNFLSVLICNIAGAFTLSAAISFRAQKNTEFENFIATGFCGGLSIFATFSKVSVGFLKDGDFLKFALFGATNLFFCVWAVYLAEAAVSKIFPSRGNALKNDMLKEESKKLCMQEPKSGKNKNFGENKNI